MTTKPTFTTTSILRGLLTSPQEATKNKHHPKVTSAEVSEDSSSVKTVKSGKTDTTASGVLAGSKSKKLPQSSLHRIASTTSLGNQEQLSTNPYQLSSGDFNQHRGEKISVKTLANYLRREKIYDAEEFIKHVTQGRENRGTEIYLALAMKDWDKKLQHALDLARAFTPDTPFKERVENYTTPEGFNELIGDYTYQEYLVLFNHHGLSTDKIQRWFKTLFGDNGKRNPIYLWG